jgi:site-specific DNA-cytosine methylase
MLEWLATSETWVHVWENVGDLLAQSNWSNLEWLLCALKRAGFVCAYGLFRSMDFGNPTRRERAYGVCLNFRLLKMSAAECQDLAQKVIDFAKGSLKTPAVDLKQILLPDRC